jgi:hypothetical protein
MGVVYFSIPLIIGFFCWKYSSEASERNLGNWIHDSTADANAIKQNAAFKKNLRHVLEETK